MATSDTTDNSTTLTDVTAIYMGAGPSVMYAAQAVEAFDQYAAKAAG